PLMPIRNRVCADSFLPEVSETVSWLASSSEHFVNKPAASSRPVVARICGGAILEIIIFLCPHRSVPAFQFYPYLLDARSYAGSSVYSVVRLPKRRIQPIRRSSPHRGVLFIPSANPRSTA